MPTAATSPPVLLATERPTLPPPESNDERLRREALALFPPSTTVLRLSPAKMRWYEAVDRALAYKRFALEHKAGLLGWLERVNIRLGSYGPDGAARKRDREEFEGDFGHGAAAGSSGA